MYAPAAHLMTLHDILLEYNIPFDGGDSKHGRLGWVQVSCPDCGDISSLGHTQHYLGISLSTGASSCWRCGRKNTARVLARLSGQPEKDIRDRLDNTILASAPVRPKGGLVLPGGRLPLQAGHKAYLTARGLDPAEIADLWGVEGIGQASGKWRSLRWRLFVPIHHHGEIISWTTRSIKKNERLRYVSAGLEQEAVPHKDVLYGADYARHAIIVHEGPIDVWATGPGAVATCGTGYTESQLLAMSKYPVRAICFDSDPAAQARAKDLANALAPFPGVTHNVELETGDDAAEADREEIAELRAMFLG